ncbi:putative all-trans-retinol 13,14-reductase [Mizuhopecten yessoensis]|uniref:All-trans-retinol 13,14-reductase n=1 Tax=Mizuhopecten yessoensis TaxID=6573 RepID=A0A210PYM2_MIZYE|nr:putative all-trans-retinol 13,14-reductase [Mizuhopecten yessoensis]OWF41586.1 all-trans-retinol 13,14-reductase [Mizuhopecten yessoensis]
MASTVMTTLADVQFYMLGLSTYPVGVSCVACCLAAALGLCLWGKGKQERGRNPFSIQHVKPILDLVTDKNTRKKILKNKFSVAKVPENIDDIVIGSGFGGLGVASLLSRAGHKVLVLEQHGRAGGSCHTFNEKGYEFDTGIHYVGNMAPGSVDRVLIDQITGGGIEYPPMDEAFDTVCLGDPENARVYDIVSDRKKLQASLIKRFPEEEEGILKLMQYFKDCEGFMDGYFVLKFLPKWIIGILTFTGIYNKLFKSYSKYLSVTTKEILERCTENQELKAVITYIFGDYGIVPSESSFGLHAMILNHYLDGAYYIRGGSSEVVFHTIPIIEGAGGQVLVKAPVNKILMDSSGHAHGVEVQTKEATIQIYAKRVISDAGLFNTFFKLLPKEIASKSCLYPMIKQVGNSLSFLTAFIGLKGTKEELGLKAHNMWTFTRTDQEQAMNEYLALSAEELHGYQIPLMFASFPSAKDPSWEKRNPGKSTCLIITLAKSEWFMQWKEQRVKRRDDEYKDLKNAIGRQMWNQLIKINPLLEGKDEFIEMGTPLSNAHYLGSPEGEMYGLEHSVERFSPPAAVHLRAETDIPGLFLTGQDILTAGFTGASFAALLCASTILNRNVHDDLTQLVKDMKKSA